MSIDPRHDALVDELNAIQKELATVVAEFLTGAMESAAEHGKNFTHYAQMTAAKRIDRNTVSETTEIANYLTGMQQECTRATGRATDTVKTTGAAVKQLKTTHDGIQEAFRRSPVNQRELAQVDPSWITPQ